MCLWVSTPTMTVHGDSTISWLCDMRQTSSTGWRHGLTERADRTVMGLFGQAPIGSLPTRSNRIWVSAARPRPTDQRKDNAVTHSRGQTWSNSDTIMLTVMAVAAPAHAADNAVRREEELIILARVGAALVGVVEQAVRGTGKGPRSGCNICGR